ncbi:E3 ubiquitin-protein ligase RFWD3 [Orchesella cincta]|uniref:RING-type E3 ubiquitin transferase n=1 Tax=Orchesella cincta TaxID=48709 RepID=A0A1D2NFP6_ORCCI|nr:E3 ubiquitin-protein ligase RFWD3 [Orchesella cincta]
MTNTSVRSEDDEGFICSICYDNFTNSGEHRVCCLKCGHVFGKECIEKWIQTQKRCPQCNCKALKRDIRILYVKNLKVMDTAELDRVKTDLQNSKEERSRVDLSNAYLRAQVDCKTKEILRLAEENKRLKLGRSSNETQEVIDLELGSVRTAESSNQQNNAFSSLRMPKIQLVKHFDIKEGNARVGAYNEWMNLLVVSHGITSALYPNGCYGIKKINSLDMKAFQSFPVHQRALRDMAFSQGQNDLLLTVGLDKKAVLFNCNSNCPVQTFTTQTPLWSCCWNTVNHNIFYVGSVMGKITSYDIRAPQEPLSTLDIPTNCKDAVARIKFVPPAYQNQAFNMSGLLIQKLNSMWFCEMLGGDDSDPRFHQLPLEGPFLNADFEPSSRHVLVSSRPKVSMGLKVGASHVVCSLGKVYSELEERDVFSCEIVQSITGGFQEASILCRSALVSPQPGQVYVAANGEGIRTVRIWDVANIEQKALVRLNQDAALDFVPGKVNEMNFLGIITDKSVDVYDMK